MTNDRERSAINIEKTKHRLFEELSKGKNSPFESMKDAVLAAACIGYENNSKIPLDNVKKIFDWDRFSHQTDIPFLHALALAEQEADGDFAEGEFFAQAVDDVALVLAAEEFGFVHDQGYGRRVAADLAHVQQFGMRAQS